jgi:hypothetical protein
MDKMSKDRGRPCDGGKSRGIALHARIGAAIVLPALLAALPSCEERQRPTGGMEARPDAATIAIPTTPTLVDAVAILRQPSQYATQKAVVGGVVHRVLGPRTFSIGGPEFGGELLVTTDRDIPATPNRQAGKYLAGGDIVVATGAVRTFASADAKKVFGSDVKEDVYMEFLGKPYVDATEIAVTPRTAQPGQPPSGAMGAGREPITDVMALFALGSADRATLAGKRVQLANVTIQKVVNDQSFWVGPNEKQMFFVRFDQPPAGGKIAKGQTIAVTGDIRKVPSADEAKKQWSLSSRDAEALVKEQVYIHAQQPAPPS